MPSRRPPTTPAAPKAPRARRSSTRGRAGSRAAATPAATPTATHAEGGGTRAAYHHGDLRNALLEAAEALLAEHGVEGLTLRECARRAGVSHGAPSHHFGDVRGLLLALRGKCFERFGAHLAAARDAATAEPFEQLLAIGLAYLDFALQYPAQFRLMFNAAKLGPAEAKDLSAGDGGYGVLRECIAATDQAAGGDGSLTEEKVVLAHTLVHGFGTLVLENPQFYAQLRAAPSVAVAFLARLLRLARPAFESTQVSAPD